GDSRCYKLAFSGRIDRAVGQVSLRVTWGRSSAPITLFTWASGTVVWPDALYWLEVDMNMFASAGWYAVRLHVVTDHAPPVASTAITYVGGGPYTLTGTGGAVLVLTGNFDTASAANALSVAHQSMLVTKGR